MARGHAAYECSEPQLGKPEFLSIIPRCAMSSDRRAAFETPPVEHILPEIGSRAFLRAAVVNSEVILDGGWQVVQPERYRYLVSHSGPMTVRLLLSEYLTCEVIW